MWPLESAEHGAERQLDPVEPSVILRAPAVIEKADIHFLKSVKTLERMMQPIAAQSPPTK
jgi:hypothetical protein